MKIIPIMKSSDPRRSIDFYTQVLDFTQTYADSSQDEFPFTLNNGEATLQLSHEGHFRTPVNFFLHSPLEVNALFEKYVSRGLKHDHPDSPVHQGPLDQTWGTREFYVNDPDGNTLRFCAWY
ncbi:MAG TPA: glyoxalase superfamily protein [Acidobacteriaceae bacterium]|jgi:catechol 2,3-dioxygenase-like lactoylglutathione lyase family enzyme